MVRAFDVLVQKERVRILNEKREVEEMEKEVARRRVALGEWERWFRMGLGEGVRGRVVEGARRGG